MQEQHGSPKPDQYFLPSTNSHWLGELLLQIWYAEFVRGNRSAARLPEESHEKSEELCCFLPQGIQQRQGKPFPMQEIHESQELRQKGY